MPNTEQIKSMVRSLLAWIGGILSTWGVIKNWGAAEQVTNFFSSELMLGAVMWLISFIWGLMNHKEANAVAVVNALPQVAGVIPANTPAGRELAVAVNSPTVAVAGTPKALEIAKVLP